MRVVSNILAVKDSQENIEHEKRRKGERDKHAVIQTPDLAITNLCST